MQRLNSFFLATFIHYRGKVYAWSNLFSVPREDLWLVKPLFSTEGRFTADQTFIQYREKVYGWSNLYSVPREGLWLSNFFSVPREGLCLVKLLFSTEGRFMAGQTFIQYRGKVYGWSNFYSVPREGLWLVNSLEVKPYRNPTYINSYA